jgi:hypothetical protein
MIRQVAWWLLTATLSFAIGLCSFTLWNDFRARRSSDYGSDLNTVALGPGVVRVRGMLYGSPDRKLTFNEMERGGAWATVHFEHSFRTDAQTREFVERLNDLASGDRMSRAEVIITGTWAFKGRHTQENEPPFFLSATGLEQAGPISLISLVSN